MADSKTTNTQDTTSESAKFNYWAVIMRVANKRRPFNTDDFKKESFIPNLSVAVPLAVGAAVKLLPMVQHILMNGRCM